MKTEKEKMLAGEVYDCADNELLTRWHKAKQLQQEYNNTLTTDTSKISDLLDELIGSRGDNVWISAPFFVDYGENIHIGNNVEINMNCVFLDCNEIIIGDYSGIGPGLYCLPFHEVVGENLRRQYFLEVTNSSGSYRQECVDRWRMHHSSRSDHW